MRFFQESGYMKGYRLKRSHLLAAVCLTVTLVIGVLVAVAGANETECIIVSNLKFCVFIFSAVGRWFWALLDA